MEHGVATALKGALAEYNTAYLKMPKTESIILYTKLRTVTLIKWHDCITRITDKTALCGTTLSSISTLLNRIGG